MKPKTLLKDVTFDFDKDEKAPLGPHLAYTLSIQGGAASGYNKALVFKARGTDITEELLKALEIAGISLEEVEVETKEEEESNNDILKSFEETLCKKYNNNNNNAH
ncbi:TPA: hypothetical protein ACPZH2_003381 [Yersinia enterocolitica]|uniref:hypothetical protein n=1 Tax=Yersinia enterocolitica TaxID=630 RepID=UPI0005E1C95F|nr:hypothetical protein [Yersinia enterocolitica]EKN6220127.1 hypothetical protein [Yersinia enterocolitica]ELI8227724.1 hypothetical protein [Yersinia enterocolitica]ELI8346206.1 hypothetical protein [Yersinia enterocolitica]ELI8390589.1 hypothetical protein [Yersinia enterocolitica]ELY5271142.1 hypothetical protein [Yersinia enterocolitica]